MHIPDNYTSPATCAVAATIMIPILAYSIKKVKVQIKRKKETIPLMAIASSLSFLIMMFNIPLPGGSTAHAVGGCLLAILIGPYAASIALTITLALQAFLFGDGGILSLGINVFNMAFIMPFSGYIIFKGCKNIFKKHGENIGAFIGGYISINIAAFFTAVELGIQPIIATDHLNNPLYNPYPLSISIPAMMITHLFIGFAEGAFTLAVYKFVKKFSCEAIYSEGENTINKKIKSINKLIILIILLCPIGLIAKGTAWGEWGINDLIQNLRADNLKPIIPKGMEEGFSFKGLFQDYTIPNVPDVIAYILCGVSAVVIFILIYRIVFKGKDKNYGNS